MAKGEGEGQIESCSCIRGCCRSTSIRLSFSSSSITLLSPISRGSESIVYEALLEGVKVVAKKPVLSTTEDLDRFHKELKILCKIDHPSIAKLLGAHARPPNYLLFFPFYENGNLAQALHVKEWSPSVETILRISLQLAQALQYLHHLDIVHRDVKPANILLDSKLGAHLADFGLAEYGKDLERPLQKWKSIGKPTGGFHKKTMVGTLIYMAPEVLRKEMHTQKSDIYSFAITINELVTGVVPYTDRRTEAQAHTVLEMNYTEQQLTAAITSDALRPVLGNSESGIPSDILSLIESCWSDCPIQRPSSDVLVRRLEEIIFNYSSHDLKDKIKSIDTNIQSTDTDAIHAITTHQNQEDISWSFQGAAAAEKLYSSVSLKNWLQLSNGKDTLLPTFSWGSFATCGRRETMEDAHFISPPLGNENHVFSCGIFDGHRGAEAAQFSATAMPKILQSANCDQSPSKALFNAFITTDKLFRNELDSWRSRAKGRSKNRHPGCTGVVAMIVQNHLFVANAGDCRTILCRNGVPIPLSKDHVASCLYERNRVVSAGVEVKWITDTWRVGTAALQVTRSIGDDDLKPAVTAEPEITQTILSIEDEYIVMASDGLWDTVNNEEVVALIKDTVKEPSMCSKRLATEAVERGSKDNITVIVVFLRPVSTVERIY